jgi:hypothetical protein
MWLWTEGPGGYERGAKSVWRRGVSAVLPSVMVIRFVLVQSHFFQPSARAILTLPAPEPMVRCT